MFDFIKYRYISISTSIILIVIGFVVTFGYYGGFASSLDFDGGLRAVVKFPKSTERIQIDSYFQKNQIEAITIPLDEEANTYQVDIGLGAVGKIKELAGIQPPKGEEKEISPIDALIIVLKKQFSLTDDSILSANQVGAVVGNELTSTGLNLLVITLAIILAYVSFRFQFRFAVAASVALIHDLLFTLAMIGFFQIKPSVPLIAALLTLLGYSINDTIVIFDRIRENSQGNLQDTFTSVINRAINQTMGRTFNTSFATLISIVAIVIGGAVELYDFAYVLIFGIFVGTYSSVFIAAPIIVIFDALRKRKAAA